MRLLWLLAPACLVIAAELPDPARDPLEKAYRFLRSGDYPQAIAHFVEASKLAPQRASIHKELGYVHLRVGETEAAKQNFERAWDLDSADERIALELAFLCHETQEEARAFELFRLLSASEDAEVRQTARTAFENVDGELRRAIERWTQAAEREPGNRSVQLELAALLEKHGEPARAVEHYLAGWGIPSEERPDEILLSLARARHSAGDEEGARATWLLASRSADVRIAETAKDHLPERFPYAAEFRGALALDPSNTRLRRDLAYLLLQVNLREEALREFETIVAHDPDDLLAAAQLADFYLARNNPAEAVRLLERAVQSSDAEVAERASERLQQIREQQARPHRELGEKSLNNSYLKDARRELLQAYEINPEDFSIALKLGVVHNLMREDRDAVRWFRIASQSSNPEVAAQARESYKNLEPQFQRVTTSVWSLPMFSSRYKDLFNYSQIKTEFNVDRLPFKPYLSLRFSGDVRRRTGGDTPQFLSENALVAGVGLRAEIHPRLIVWGEGGQAFHYLGNRPPGVPRAGPDYRGGVSWFHNRGATLGGGEPGRFLETNADAVYVSRFENDAIAYVQLRPGYRLADRGPLKAQVFWNFNVTTDAKRLYWANFVETGPGLRLRMPGVSPPMDFSISFVRGVHLVNAYNPRRPNYFDLRVGLWYSAGF